MQKQFQNMTPEQIEFHSGLEKVRNVTEGFPENHGIEHIRKLAKEAQELKKCSGCKAKTLLTNSGIKTAIAIVA